ncbi:PREDICTED: uncharacterized protein LOC104605702 [Nelumbo nucifera]|uniref:Precursor of CEP9-like n=2 Tax=Nelumbo nucifera TaxID=4432 RepID=A0A822ZHP8_NELNU|nr:PREDICTED: uncharacterized protein LOC104605702 [Nelumbo nucifera]DAD41208.1 TPA_asm: hypothetical protein HUJ06_015531 [Nelumbo nucifera]
MANVKSVLTCVSLLLLVFSHELRSIEGRHLSFAQKKESPNKKSAVINTESSPTENTTSRSETTTRMVASIDASGSPLAGQPENSQAALLAPSSDNNITDFRPTTPGHSPGVGHSRGGN